MDADVHLSKSVTISAHQWLKRPAAKSSQICTIRIDISTLLFVIASPGNEGVAIQSHDPLWTLSLSNGPHGCFVAALLAMTSPSHARPSFFSASTGTTNFSSGMFPV